MDGRIFHVKEKLINNLRHNWTIAEMADEVGLSLPHFQKIFKSNIGCPPMTFLQDLRLEEARKLLETTFLQIQEIRIAVGIAHNSHFTRDFKTKYNLTPTEYRKSQWNKVQSAHL